MRSRGGRLVLRIEDIDSPRIKAGAAEQALDDLCWLGLDWDEGPIFQTRRLTRYQAALRQLQQGELVYPCTCSRRDVEQAASAPHGEHEGPAYPGTCSWRQVCSSLDLAGQDYAWRFRTHGQSPSFSNSFLGQTSIDLQQVGGDFVVWQASDTPAYQLAVVVDDADSGVTEVLRGDDLVPSTPRQLLLYQALGLTPPRFVHVPLVIGPDGRRLAKRHGDTRLASLRAAGVRPEALLGLLAWSCHWIEQPEPITARELLPHFRLETIPRRPFVLEATLLQGIGFSP
jgi:glutamyl-tRNA synthetase